MGQMASKEGVMGFLSPFLRLEPYHMLIYGTLLGTELFQTFVNTKVCYQALPMSAFTTLQKRVFPLYFRLQSLLLVLTAATVPPYSVISLVTSTGDLIPLTVAGAMAALNLFKFGPSTMQAMIDRIHQETRDGRKYDDAEVSEEMRKRNKKFSREHAMSIHLNLIAVGATVWYGFNLASHLNFVPE